MENTVKKKTSKRRKRCSCIQVEKIYMEIPLKFECVCELQE